MVKTALAATLAMLPALVVAQVNCKTFEKAIDESLRVIAVDYIAYGRDESAPRHTNRLLKANMEWSAIGLQVSLMAQNKCPPIRSPITTDAYMAMAKVCLQKANELGGAKSTVVECDPANWKRPE